MSTKAYANALKALLELQICARDEAASQVPLIPEKDGLPSLDRGAVGARMKVLRQVMNVTQKEMGEMLDISWRSYQNYEIGSREVPFGAACKFARLTGVSMEWIALGEHTRIGEANPE